MWEQLSSFTEVRGSSLEALKEQLRRFMEADWERLWSSLGLTKEVS